MDSVERQDCLEIQAVVAIQDQRVPLAAQAHKDLKVMLANQVEQATPVFQVYQVLKVQKDSVVTLEIQVRMAHLAILD